MIVIKNEQIIALKPYIKDLDTIIGRGCAQDILDTIDDIIVDNILGNGDEPDEVGIKLQRIYDQILEQNS